MKCTVSSFVDKSDDSKQETTVKQERSDNDNDKQLPNAAMMRSRNDKE